MSSGEDLPWDELEVEDVQVLPDEALGWLVLRRANLSSSSRLSVQASVQNSLSFRAIERCEIKKRTATTKKEGRGGRRVGFANDSGRCRGRAGVGDRLLLLKHILKLLTSTSTTMSTNPKMRRGYGYWVETDGYGACWSADPLQRRRRIWTTPMRPSRRRPGPSCRARPSRRQRVVFCIPLARARGKRASPETMSGQGYGGWRGASSSSAMAVNGYSGCFIFGIKRIRAEHWKREEHCLCSFRDEWTELHDHGARGGEGFRERRGHDDGRS